MKLRHFLLAAAAVITAGTIAGAQVGRTPNFGDSFIRDAFTPTQTAQVNPDSQLSSTPNARGSVYSAVMSGLVIASTANGDGVVIGGSATQTVRVNRIVFSGQATAVVTSQVAFIKRSTVPVVGTGYTVTPVPWDSSSAAGTATVSAYTAAPTVGTAVGVVKDISYVYSNKTTGIGQGPFTVTFDSPVVLRGTAQTLSINWPAGGPSGNVLDVTVEWTESTN